jgi:hypothetical protein
MKIETKFNPGQTVWIMIDNKPKECVIDEVIPGRRSRTFTFRYQDAYTITGYNGSSPKFYEEQIFTTKEELIKSL